MAPAPDDLRALLIKKLQATSSPQSTARLARLCGLRSPLPVTQVLQTLHRESLVRVARAGWTWIGPLPQREPPAPGSRRGAARGPVRNRPGSEHGGSRWASFRALCRYYADAARLDERSQLKAYANREGQDFLALRGGIDWQALAAGHAPRLSLKDRELAFARKGTAGRQQARWFVGAPIDVSVGKDKATGETWVALEPVFHVEVVPELDGTGLTLHPTGGVEVNPGWLQRRCRRADRRREFLAVVGLEEAGGFDDEGERPLRIEGFREAISALWHGYRDWWQEYANLDELRVDPPAGELREKGIHNRAILMRGPELKYTRRLIAELRALADERRDEELDGTALAPLFPHEKPPREARTDPAPEVAEATPVHGEMQLLNEEQRQAVAAAREDPLVVLTGPPGTGKSVVVAHAMANLALAGRSVLFASRNHQALEAVEPRLNALVEPELLVMRPSRKWGSTVAQQEWEQALTTLLAKPRPENAESLREQSAARLRAAQAARSDTERQIAELLEARDELARVEGEMEPALAGLDAEGAERAWNVHAGVPAAPELDALLARIDAWRERQAAQGLGASLRRAWHGVLRALVRVDPAAALRARVRVMLAAVDEATGRRERVPAGRDPTLAAESAALRERRAFVLAHDLCGRATALRSAIEARADLGTLNARLAAQQDELQESTGAALRTLAETAGARLSPEQRERFAALRAALENHRGSWSADRFQRAFAKALPELLRHFPLWAVSNLSAGKASPLAPGLFDLLIVDEASQCDIASVVPLLFRARRAMVVGDPMQLRHVSNLPRETDLHLRAKHGLAEDLAFERYSVGANSVYDLASSSRTLPSALQLRAHYRCHPDIAEFCSRAFYGGSLRVMTDRARLRGLPGAAATMRGCEWTDARGEIVAAASGCHSPAITAEVVSRLRELADAGFDGTVGVVTPFRIQADRIRDLAHKELPRDRIARWELLVQTVDSFQGDERDVVLFALTGGPGMPPGSRGFLASTANRFNVAVSRARSFLRVIGDADWARGCGIAHIGALLEACERAAAPAAVRRHDLIGPVWEPRLADALRAAGIEFEQQYPACGFYLDFALFAGDRKIDVEVDGETYHRDADGGRKADDLYRDFVLQGAGWVVLRFWVYELRENLDECVRRIRRVRDGGE